MLKGLEISNYRGIRQAKIRGFGQVNIFVGPNGSGKSSVLEAIFLLGASPHGNRDFNFHGAFQGSNYPLIALRHNENGFPSPDLWYGKELRNSISVTYEFDRANASITIVAPSSISWNLSDPPSEELASYLTRIRLLDIRVLLDRSLEQQAWDQLLNIRGDRILRQVMNEVYGLNIESLTYSAYNQSLKALFTDRNYALNIDDLGAGMRIAFRMIIAILLSQDSATLAEEFDGYQHVESFPRFVRALMSVSARTRAQLFLATHNVETVANFIEQSRSKTAAVDLKVFQTSLSKDGVFEASPFTAEEAESLISGGFDIRRTS